MHSDWARYVQGTACDELAAGSGRARPGASALLRHLKQLGGEELLHRKKAAEQAIRAMGVTFTV